MAAERSFIAIKPDGVQRGLVGEILGRFERKGFKLVGLKQLTPSRELAEQHYGVHKERPFFAGLVLSLVWLPSLGIDPTPQRPCPLSNVLFPLFPLNLSPMCLLCLLIWVSLGYRKSDLSYVAQ